MEKGALIGEGRTAEIFAWGEDKVLKLFREGWSTGTAEHEARIARQVQEAGVNTPLLSEVLEVEGRPGLIYQRVDGRTMLLSLSRNPLKVRYFARKLAELQAAIHQRTTTGLPSQRQKLLYAIANAPYLTAATKERLQAQLNIMPDGTAICHGDFHPDNILLSAKGPVIIDWTNASAGNPLADMAHSCMVMSFGPIPPGTPLLQKSLISIFRRVLVSTYRRYYLRLHPDTKGELKHWYALAAAARLEEGIPGEKKGLLRVVEKYLSNN